MSDTPIRLQVKRNEPDLEIANQLDYAQKLARDGELTSLQMVMQRVDGEIITFTSRSMVNAMAIIGALELLKSEVVHAMHAAAE